MTDIQKITLILFAQNYRIPTIALKQKVSTSTIKARLKRLSKNYPEEFNNALALREVYKRNRKSIKNAAVFNDSKIAAGGIKKKF